MATLRDRLINAHPVDLREFAPEQQMGDFRRGLRTGGIGTDVNTALAEESALRAEGRVAEADQRRAAVNLLRQQQSVAPVRVQRLEDINGVGDAVDWAQGALGQGLASMAAPVAAGVGTAALGQAMQFAPNQVMQGAGKFLRGPGAFLAPAAIGAEQMKGEFYGEASADPELMARTSAQDLNRTGNMVGLAGGALDAILPGVVARSAVGAGLRSMNPLGKIAGGMALEGGTEVGQGEISRQTRLGLNPEMDTSGFGSERLNEFAAGAVVGGPFSAASAVADNAYNATEKGITRASDMAGQTLDLLGETAGPAAEKATGAAKEAATSFAKMFRGKTVDLKADDLVDRLKEASKSATSGWKARREEMDLIQGVPPEGISTDDGEAYGAWFSGIQDQRNNLIRERLSALAEAGDEQAAALMPGLESGEGVEQAAQYLARTLTTADAARAAERAGDALGKVVRGTGKVAGEFGSAMWQAMRGTRKNAQAPGPRTAQEDMAGEVLKSRPGDQLDADAAANRNVLNDAFDVAKAKANSLRRAKLMGEYLAAVAEAEKPRYKATRAENVMPKFMKDVGGELSDLIESWRDAAPAPVVRGNNEPVIEGRKPQDPRRPEGPTTLLKQPSDSRGQQFDGLRFNLNRIANQLIGAYGENAFNVAADLRNVVGDDPQAGAILELLQAEVEKGISVPGRRDTEALRRAAAETLLEKLPQEVETKLLGQGINLRSEEGKRQLLGMVESIATGRVRPEARAALSKLLGDDVLTDMVEAIALPSMDTTNESSMFGGSMDMNNTENGFDVTDDGDVVDATTSVSDFDERAAEKSLTKASGATYYGFRARPTLNNSQEARNPFGFLRKLSKEARKQRYAEGDVDRPALFGPEDAAQLQQRVESMQRKLGPTFKVSRKLVSQVMDDLNMGEGARVRLLADYLKADLAKMPAEERGPMENLRQMAVAYLQDMRDGVMGDDSQRKVAEFRTTPKQREYVRRQTERYFNRRHMAVAEPMTDASPDVMTPADVKKILGAGALLNDSARDAEATEAVKADAKRLLVFPVAQGADTKAKTLYAKAQDLAAWGRNQRYASTKSDMSGADTRSETDRDREYIADLLSGLSALAATGMVGGMPKLGAQSFANGIPLGLELPSGRRYADIAPNEKRASPEGPQRSDPDDVLEDQMRGDFFTPDDSMAEEATYTAERSEAEAKARAQRKKDQGDKRLVRQIVSEERRERLVSGEDRSPETDAVFDAQRRTSREQGFDPVTRSRETRTAAPELAPLETGTPKAFMQSLNTFAEAMAKMVNAVPDVRVDPNDPDAPGVAGRFAATSERQLEGVKAVRRKQLDELVQAYERHLDNLTEKQDARAKAIFTKAEQALNARPTAPAQEGGAPVGKSRAAPSGAPKRRLNAQSAGVDLNAKLTALLAERGITVDAAALEGVPIENRLSLVSRSIMADPKEPMAPEVGRFVSWMLIGSEFYNTVADAIAGTALERSIQADVDRNPTQSLYTPARKRREVVRVAVERLLVNGLYKKYAAQQGLSAKVIAVVRGAITGLMTQLGGVKFRELQGQADNLVAGILDGSVKLERTKKPGSVLVDPYKVFEADPHAAGIAAALASTPNFTLTGSLAYAGQGTVYRPAAMAIHDLDFITNMSQRRAEETLMRLYPQAKSARSFGGLGSFVSTFVVPPKGHTVGSITMDGGVITGYTVRDGNGAVVGRYVVKDGEEVSTGTKATIVDLISDARTSAATMRIPTSFGEQTIRVSSYQDAMAEKLLYARDKDIADFANFVPYGRKNQQTSASSTGKVSTPEERKAAADYVKRVLGPKIKVEFENMTTHSGEWIETADVIKIATAAGPGAMQTAYHEALHAFMSKYVHNNPRVMEVLQALADHGPTVRRLEALLANEPAALKQLAEGEERLAYIFQFWRAGLLDLPSGAPKTLMQKIARFFRRVLGMIRDTDRASVIFEAFHEGKMAEPSAAGRAIAEAIDEGTWSRKQLRKMDGLVQKAAALTMPAESILKTSVSPTARKIGELFFVNPSSTDDTASPMDGYLNARDQMSKRYSNEFARIMAGMTDRDFEDVGQHMVKGTEEADIAYEPHRKAVHDLRALLQRFRTYMVDERGVKMGDLGPKYFPRVWSSERLIEKRDEFIAMVNAKYPGRDAEGIHAALLQNAANDIQAGRPQDESGVLAPLNRGGEERVLSWMDPADAAPFVEDSLVGVLTRYFHEGARAAEYTARFGQDGEKLNNLIFLAKAELAAEALKMVERGELKDKDAAKAWAHRQVRDIEEAVGAMEGTLGKDISATWRNTNSWVVVYQNIRLLPLSLFSSVVDPLGLIVRGAEMKDAFEAFLRGMQEVGRTWRDMFKDEPAERQADRWQRLAEYVGSVDAAVFDTQVADMYASTYMSPTAKRINDKFFKLNGMEGWNRGMRVGATKAAVKFIERHSKLPEGHSKRWLEELGLTPADIELDAEGNLMVSVGELMAARNLSREDARVLANKLHTAINRWVTGAVLTPNAAQRPAWSSDPHYSMFFHLKQFTYSFHQIILKRVYNEMQAGNLAPLAAMFWYTPVMIASDITKGVLQGGGDLPAHMKGMDAGEWFLYGAERAGILGLGNLGLDVNQDLASIGGPAVEQIIDAFSDPLDRTMVKAAPANPIFAEAFR